MNRVRTMVSSTCYDLAPVRESVADALTSLGFDPILSERPDFPTLPHLTPVENCRRAARDCADLLILIIGRRSGSIAPGTANSITNLEYREAVAVGIPVLVFVDSEVHSLLRVWRKNHDADFSDLVESTKVFEFLEEVLANNRWIFEFSNVADIITGIREKSSQLFRYLLDLRRGLEDLPNTAFRDESPRIRDLLVTRPHIWEHKLFAELLLDRLRPLKARIESLRTNGVFLPVTERISVEEYPKWGEERLFELERVSPILLYAANHTYPQAVSSTTESIDLIGLRDSVERIREGCRGATAWEERQRSAIVPEMFSEIHKISLVWGGDYVRDVLAFAEELKTLVYTPEVSGVHPMTLRLHPLSDIDRFKELFANIDIETYWRQRCFA